MILTAMISFLCRSQRSPFVSGIVVLVSLEFESPWDAVAFVEQLLNENKSELTLALSITSICGDVEVEHSRRSNVSCESQSSLKLNWLP
jgi:hypothetical protein